MQFVSLPIPWQYTDIALAILCQHGGSNEGLVKEKPKGIQYAPHTSGLIIKLL